MNRFKKILVPVDLSSDDLLVADSVSPSTLEAIDRGIWLAEKSSAMLTFLYVLDLPARTQRLIAECQGKDRTVLDQSEDALARYAIRAFNVGVKAVTRTVYGKSWVEIIRQVQREQHDLVIAGARQRQDIQHAVMGTTGLKLLRKCPCPVWITKPRPKKAMSSILVATDFTPVSDLALELAVSMAQLQQCTVDVLHVLEFGRDNHLKLMHRTSGDTLPYREQAREEAIRHLEECVKSVDLPHPPAKHLLVGHADDVIPAYIDKNNIDLLIMGTLARTGIPGVFVGNTADRVLPKVSCSLLGVKPADFKSPVTIPAQHTAMA